jgi:phage terminase large subunit
LSPFARPLSYFESRFHRKQEDAWLAYKAGRTLVLPWGRRSGKSDLFAEILVEDLEEHGFDCLYLAKTQKQARQIIWKKLRNRIRKCPDWKLIESSLEAVHIPSGSSIYVRGADLGADNLPGAGYRVIVCDEFALWRNPEITGILAPMLGDYDGTFIYGSTKRGKNHFHRLHERALREPSKFYASEATIFDNPFITASGRSKVLSEYEGGEKNPLYRQEILNEYVTFEGQVFALDPEHYTRKRWDNGVMEHCYHWRGMDHGFSPDATAAVWVAYNPKSKKFQVYSEYEAKALLISQHADVIKAVEPYDTLDTYSDIDPQVIAEYEAVGLSLTPAEKADKHARVLRLVTALQSGRVEIASNCVKLLAAMAEYTWEMVEDGDDPHLIDAFRYVFTNLVVPEAPAPAEDTRQPKHTHRHTEDTRFTQSFGSGD